MKQNNRSGFSLGAALIGCGAAWLLCRKFLPSMAGILLRIFGIVAIVLVLLVIAVVVAAFWKPKKTPEQEREEAERAILKQARLDVMAVRTASMRIKDPQIRQSGSEISGTLDRILKTLEQNPNDLPHARRFLRHSLPMLSGILKKYQVLEQSGIPAETVRIQTVDCLRDLEQAAQKQYENLFADDIVDITAEMEVLTAYCRQNGLLEEEQTL